MKRRQKKTRKQDEKNKEKKASKNKVATSTLWKQKRKENKLEIGFF